MDRHVYTHTQTHTHNVLYTKLGYKTRLNTHPRPRIPTCPRNFSLWNRYPRTRTPGIVCASSISHYNIYALGTSAHIIHVPMHIYIYTYRYLYNDTGYAAGGRTASRNARETFVLREMGIICDRVCEPCRYILGRDIDIRSE